MIPDEMLELMKAAALMDDTEAAHDTADKIMVTALRERGFGKAMDVFEKMDKWYA
jgi:hypothetical protein